MSVNRWKASGLHLGFSVVIGGVVWGLMRGLWFPGPLFEVSGAGGLLSILVPADVVLGPLLTLIVYKAGKPSLKWDLTIIVIVQLAALFYGVWTIAEARPAYVVFFGNQLKVVRSVDLAEGKPWQTPLTGPVWVGIPAAGALDAEISDLLAGLNNKTPAVLDRTRYQPWPNVKSGFAAALRPLTDFSGPRVTELEQGLAAKGLVAADVLFLPITVRDVRMTAVFSASSHQWLATLPVSLPAK